MNPPGAEIRVVKSDGSIAAPGEEGEMRVKGPQLCKGYLDTELNAAAFDVDGFFRCDLRLCENPKRKFSIVR